MNPMRYYEPVGASAGQGEDQEFYNNNNRMRGAGYYYYQQQQQRPALTTTSSTTLRPTANSRPVKWDPYVSGNNN